MLAATTNQRRPSPKHDIWKFQAQLPSPARISVGTTVFRSTQNFEPSCGICHLLWNFYVFAEFCGIRYWQ